MGISPDLRRKILRHGRMPSYHTQKKRSVAVERTPLSYEFPLGT